MYSWLGRPAVSPTTRPICSGQPAAVYDKLLEGVPFVVRARPPPLVADVHQDRPIRNRPSGAGGGRARARGRGRGRAADPGGEGIRLELGQGRGDFFVFQT